MLTRTIVPKLFRCFATSQNISKITLPDLKFDPSSFQPVLTKASVQLHHKKLHQQHVTELNAALKLFQQAKTNLNYNQMSILTDLIKFHLGGHVNHSILWQNLAPIGQGGGVFPDDASPLTKRVKEQFGSYQSLIQEITKKTFPIQGSGWGWLTYDNLSKCLRLVALPNHQMPQTLNLTPLLAIDVWEHGYAIDYKSDRLEYLKNLWKIVNWKNVQKRYINASQKKQKNEK